MDNCYLSVSSGTLPALMNNVLLEHTHLFNWLLLATMATLESCGHQSLKYLSYPLQKKVFLFLEKQNFCPKYDYFKLVIFNKSHDSGGTFDSLTTHLK